MVETKIILIDDRQAVETGMQPVTKTFNVDGVMAKKREIVKALADVDTLVERLSAAGLNFEKYDLKTGEAL